jgi:hypothetical protein
MLGLERETEPTINIKNFNLEELARSDRQLSPRSFVAIAHDIPGNSHIVGLTYQCDFKAEEEWGIGDIAKVLNNGRDGEVILNKDSKKHIAFFSDCNGMVISTSPLSYQTLKWGEQGGERFETGRLREEYPESWERLLDYTQGVKSRWTLERAPFTELKAMAKEFEISPIPRSRKELAIVLSQHPRLKEEKSKPLAWPGYFQDGKNLILRADEGPTSEVLKALIESAKSGNLMLINSSVVFARGMILYDVRSETKELKKERAVQIKEYRKNMKVLERLN